MVAAKLLATFGLIVAAAPAIAHQDNGPAPAGGPNTLYCLRVDAITGSRLETIQCRTRDDWSGLEIDVDKEWAENGVRIVG